MKHTSDVFSEGAPKSAALPIPPSAAVFLTSMSFMLVEMNAGRLTSWHIGSSLHSWTSVIGVMFGGMSLGNYIGGRLAEGADLRRTLGRLYLWAAIATLSILWTHNFVYGVEDGWVAKARAAGMDWIPVAFERFIDWFSDSFSRLTRVVILCSLSFLPSALLLGMISPVIAKIALDTLPQPGRAIGSVYAWGAVGSIAGTFLAGFFLISFLGMRGLLSATAVLLSVLGILLGRQKVLNSCALGASALTLVFGTASWLWAYNIGAALKIRETRDDLLFVHESDYQYLRCYRSMHELEIVSPDGNVEIRQVVDREYRRLLADPPPGRMRKVRELRSLTLDHLIHGYVWLRMPPNAPGEFDARRAVFDARDLHYAYEQIYAVLTYRTSRHVKDRPLTTLSLGAGSYTFPRYLYERYPGSLHDVAEIDPAVTLACRRALKLDLESLTVDGAPAVRVYHADARNFVEAALAKGWTYDVIYGDAFNHYSIPFHLTTKEFHDEIRALLKPGGAYLANVIDTYESSRFLAWYARTLQETFNHVHIACQRAATAVTTDDGLERVCEEVVFEGVAVELLDASGAVIASRDADDVFRVRKKRDGLWMLTHDGGEIRGAAVRYRGGKAHLFPPAGRDGTRRSITIDGSSIKSVEERNRRSRDTFVIVASVEPVDLDRLGMREGDPRFLRAVDRRLSDVDRITVFTPQETARMFRRTGASVFRDDFAPVDNLLIPVFTDRD